jgi:putative nucleotidyltransferase with HDIG domain
MVRITTSREVEALRFELLRREIFAAAEKLPPFPDVVWKVIPLIRKTAPVAEIEAVIAYDPVISARVLALGQSSYYARRRRIGSLSEAVSVLGGRQLIQVILTACASRFFCVGTARADQAESRLWEHSIAVGLGAEMTASRSRGVNPLKGYLGGLLHDIGKTVLIHHWKIHADPGPGDVEPSSLESLEAERRVLGVDHETLGRSIALRWRLPGDVTIAIGCHHSPELAPHDRNIAKIVYAADHLANRLKEDGQGDGKAGDFAGDAIFAELGISGPDAEELLARLREAVDGVRHFLASDDAAPGKAPGCDRRKPGCF